MSFPALHPRKQPRQTRSTATVETILEAATRVLSDQSLAGFNTNRIAEVAGVSVGSVYQYFPNKAALVVALIERAQNALAKAIEMSVQNAQGKTLTAVLTDLIDIAIEHQFDNARLATALDHEEQRLPLQEILGAAQSRIVRAVQGILDNHRELSAASLPAQAAVDCLTITKAMVEEHTRQTPVDLSGLRERVLRALMGYLFAPVINDKSAVNRSGRGK